MLEKYKCPWAVVFGNHDHDGGIDVLDKAIEFLQGFEHFTYENGPNELGRGNYIINISDGEKIIHSLFMMDTHDRVPYIKENGDEVKAWGKLTHEQLDWYREKVTEVKALGSQESTLIIHIPIYAYNYAWDSAFNKEYDPKSITPEQSSDPKYWNEGYKDSFGVKYENASTYPTDDGVFDIIKELEHTKNILAGHSHIDNYSIVYEGVRLTFALKTTTGSYYDPLLNGGTVLTVKDNGSCSIHHEYVDISKYLKKGKNELEITLTTSNRNLLGPFHSKEGEPGWVGPETFERFGSWENGKSKYLLEKYAFIEPIV